MTDAEADYFGIERWAPAPGCTSCSVSTLGRVRGASGRILRQTPHHNGYMRVRLWCPKTKAKPTWRVHRLVATAFIPNPYNLPEVHHVDHNIENNAVLNLQWVDRQMNMDYRYAEDRDQCSDYYAY